MYAEFAVDIPTCEDVFIYRGHYVRYCTGRKYDPSRHYNIPSYVVIGKVCHSNPGKMYPNENFFKYFDPATHGYPANIRTTEQLHPAIFLVLRKMFAKYQKLLPLFHDKKITLSFRDRIASYIITGRFDANDNYPKKHPLFSDNFMADDQFLNNKESLFGYTWNSYFRHLRAAGYHDVIPRISRLEPVFSKPASDRIRQKFIDEDISSYYSVPDASNMRRIFEFHHMIWISALIMLSDMKIHTASMNEPITVPQIVRSLEDITLIRSPIQKYCLLPPLSSEQERLLHTLGLGKTTLNTFIRKLNSSDA